MEDPLVTDLKEVLVELKEFLDISRKPRIKSLLNKEISQIENELNTTQS